MGHRAEGAAQVEGGGNVGWVLEAAGRTVKCQADTNGIITSPKSVTGIQ